MSNSKTKVQGRIPEDTANRFEEWRDARNLNQTEAVKRLVKDGLDAQNRRKKMVSQYLVTVGAVASVIATWTVFASSRALLTGSLVAFAVVSTVAGFVVTRR